ncbi:hypothetical protein ASD62_11070 [Phycicoccus sp. Root563]|uniref:HEAT repeat domain-containing protein n=1 Tax=Phycicoccus sp. Root563 TaxID=1736562 RepID=UPI0007027490|nr:HEAT repeat domain-containing protein [Phycicoccus sp. Root563]KQZ89762.1 hypothetical protein ASD62_11070 [Phycicoccus sp. Root563]
MPTYTPVDQRPDAELSLLARAIRPDVARQSLAVLALRESASLPGLSQELVLGHGDDRVRALSAVILGRIPGAASQEALLTALGDPEPTVQRRVAQALGRVGDSQALETLARLQPPEDTPVGRDVRMARVLLSHRLGVADSLVQPVEMSTFTRTRGVPIAWKTRSRLGKAAVVASAERELPGIALTTRSVQTFTCGDTPGALAVDAGLRGQAQEGRDLFASPRLVGALLRERACSERYTLDGYVLTDDRDGTGGAEVHVWVVRPDGTVVHEGRATVEGTSVRFSVDRSQAPYGSPVRVSGTYDTATGALSVDEAIVGLPNVRAAQAAAPSPQVPAGG